MKDVLQKIRKTSQRVLVIGETILDEWYVGKLARVCQEDKDIRIFDRSGEEIELIPGGAMNVVENLRVLIGDSRVVERSNISYETSTKTRYVDKKTGKLIFRSDNDRKATPFEVPSEMPFDRIVISDYGKGFLPWDTLWSLAEKFPKKRVIFSPHISKCRTCNAHIMEKLKKWVWVLNHEEDVALPMSVLNLDLMAVVTHGKEPIRFSGGTYMLHNRVSLPHSCAIGDVFLAAFSAAQFCTLDTHISIPFAAECCQRVLASGRGKTHRITEEDLK